MARNDKGLVTYDRKVRKDAFYFYKANWSTEPVLYLTDRRFAERTNAVIQVKAYSNLATATLSMNHQLIGTGTNDGNGVMVWPNVRLTPGENQAEVQGRTAAGQELADQCKWHLSGDK